MSVHHSTRWPACRGLPPSRALPPALALCVFHLKLDRHGRPATELLRTNLGGTWRTGVLSKPPPDRIHSSSTVQSTRLPSSFRQTRPATARSDVLCTSSAARHASGLAIPPLADARAGTSTDGATGLHVILSLQHTSAPRRIDACAAIARPLCTCPTCALRHINGRFIGQVLNHDRQSLTNS